MSLFAGFDASPEELGVGSHNMWMYLNEDGIGDMRGYISIPDPEVASETKPPLVIASFNSAKENLENRGPRPSASADLLRSKLTENTSNLCSEGEMRK